MNQDWHVVTVPSKGFGAEVESEADRYNYVYYIRVKELLLVLFFYIYIPQCKSGTGVNSSCPTTAKHRVLFQTRNPALSYLDT